MTTSILLPILLPYQYLDKIPLIFSKNSETYRSEFQDNLEEILPQ